MRWKAAFLLLILALAPTFAGATMENPANARPKAVVSKLEHSFGTVKPGTPLTHAFVVRNEGKADLEITNVSPSCGCTTSHFDKLIPPGKEGKITLAVEKTENYKGEVVKNATVTTNDPAKPSFTLVLRANFAAE